MTMPYHVIIGRRLSIEQKKEVSSLIEETFREIDQTFNHFNPLSEISRLNGAPPNVFYPLSGSLYRMLAFCNGLVQLSSNRFDPTIGYLGSAWKKAFQSSLSLPFEDQQTAADAVGWQHLTLREGLFRKDHPRTYIDLSSPAKGLCVDWIAERLLGKGYRDFFVEWSGKIRAQGRQPSGQLWQVQIDPNLRRDNRPFSPIPLNNLAIATCADCNQKNWHFRASDGQERYFFNIIDPIQSHPLEKTDFSIASVTVIAPTCALANALATAAMVFPTRKEAESWAQEVIELYPQVSFWILAYDIKTQR